MKSPFKTLPAECNARDFNIVLLWDENSGRYLKVVLPKESEHNRKQTEDVVTRKWIERFGPTDHDEITGEFMHQAEGLLACTFPYDGPTALSDQEQKAILDCGSIGCCGVDMTLDLVWLFVERLGIRPGQVRQGGRVHPETFAEISRWLPPDEDRTGSIELACIFLLLDVEGRPNAILPQSYSTGLACSKCGRESKVYLHSKQPPSPFDYEWQCGCR